ncbi:MAG: DUF1080 domain-containing protein, partial [Sedimentisphaerales bacterium]|nr:DUF1080 domain-containing protein [Sedimentisphaerales bacterium]
YFLIQFGHNDCPGKGDRYSDPESTFQDHIRRYVTDSQAIGAIPMLVTPMTRRNFTPDGGIRTILRPYADAMLKVAREENVAVIDLHARSVALFESLGEVGSADLGTDEGRDRTHFSLKGARVMARLVVDGLPEGPLKDRARLARHPVASSDDASGIEFTEAIVGDAMPGWEVKGGPEGAWFIKDGVLHNPGGVRGGGWMGTREDYSDFVIDLEFNVSPGGNSGVFLRAPEKGRISAIGLEIQILDDYAEKHKQAKPTQRCGAVYLIAGPSKPMARPAGKWNHMTIIADHDHIVVELNSETIVDVDGTTHPEILKRRRRGPIGLQNYGVPASFRNIKVADLTRGRPDPHSVTSRSAAEGRIPAFPGADGFGADTTGGRGGKVLFVENLEDYRPAMDKPVAGSLRAACSARGPRILVFRIAGTIALKAPLVLTDPYITIAGQTAPGGGVCLRRHGMIVQTHDVIIRHVRFRPGDEFGREQLTQGEHVSYDALLFSSGSRNAIVDHCSTSWGTDEVLSVSSEGVTNVSAQWCMITESLNWSSHEKGEHGYGSLLRCNGNLSFHHNLYAHHKSRTPRVGTYGPGCVLLDFRNNLIYNVMEGGYTGEDPAHINYVGNIVKRGPDSRRQHAFYIGGETTQLYVENNRMSGFDTVFHDDWDMIRGARECNRCEKPFSVAAVPTDDVDVVYERILASCGATLPVRDAVDARIVKEVRSTTGRVIDSQERVGGWPELKPAVAPKDVDRDGMPDEWESRHGLNPADASDNRQDSDGDGYTNIEEALNRTDPRVKDGRQD